jgi:ribosomal protein S6
MRYNAPMTKDSQLYEIGHLLKASSPEEAEEKNQEIKKIIEDNKGIILEQGQPDQQRLAYPIEKLEEAYFGWLQFSTNPDEIQKIKKEIEKNKAILRYSIISIKKVGVQKPRIIKPRREYIKKETEEKRKAVPKKQEEIVKSEEIDKQLEEILG